MVIDNLGSAAKYATLHPSFAEAFEYLRNINMDSLVPGEIRIKEGIKAIVMDEAGKSRQEALIHFECHRQHIDIQFCMSGTEEMGWRSLQTCKEPKTEFDAGRDVQFFNDPPDTFFSLKPGQFVIFFPDDVHAPMISDGPIKKVVIKISIEFP